MVKIGYFSNASYSINALLKNLVLYIPDIIYYIITAVLALLFLYFNDLTGIFSNITLFGTQIKSIINSSNLLTKLIISLIISVIINLVVGLGTITLRYNLVKNVIQKKKSNFRSAYKTAGKYLLSIFGIKILLTFIYLIPLVVFVPIGLVYRPLLILMIILVVITWIILRFVFLFIYPTLFLKTNKGSVRAIKQTINYFNDNKKHVLLTGLFVFIVSITAALIVNSLSSGLGSGFVGLTPLIIVGLIVKSLVDISVILWSALFLFNNYQT